MLCTELFKGNLAGRVMKIITIWCKFSKSDILEVRESVIDLIPDPLLILNKDFNVVLHCPHTEGAHQDHDGHVIRRALRHDVHHQ